MPIATHSDNGASEVHTHHELDLPVMSTLRKSDIETLLKKKKQQINQQVILLFKRKFISLSNMVFFFYCFLNCFLLIKNMFQLIQQPLRK